MNAFDYVAPQSVDEAISLLAADGDQARILAGGTDLIAQLKEGKGRPKLLVDVKKIPDANVLSYSPGEGLRIGSGVPCCSIYEYEPVPTHYPALVDSTSLIGSIQIQGRATIGGNLCNSSPAADSTPTIIVLEGVCEIAGPNGTREVAAENFCLAPGKSALEKGEFLVAVRFPAPKPNSGAFFLRFIPRNEMDIAVVNAAASVVLNGNSISSARIAVGAVAPTPLFLTEAAKLLEGQEISDELIDRAAEVARDAARPITDMRGTVDQRRHLAGVLTKRALKGAIQRARES